MLYAAVSCALILLWNICPSLYARRGDLLVGIQRCAVVFGFRSNAWVSATLTLGFSPPRPFRLYYYHFVAVLFLLPWFGFGALRSVVWQNYLPCADLVYFSRTVAAPRCRADTFRSPRSLDLASLLVALPSVAAAGRRCTVYRRFGRAFTSACRSSPCIYLPKTPRNSFLSDASLVLMLYTAADLTFYLPCV